MASICQGKTKTGAACRAKACNGTMYCNKHQDWKETVSNESDKTSEVTKSDDSVTTTSQVEVPQPETIQSRGMKRAKSVKKDVGVTYSSERFEADASEALENVDAKLEELFSMTSAVKAQLQAIEAKQATSKGNRISKAKGNASRKPWELTESRALNSAKWAFYSEHKNDVNIVNDIRHGLMITGKLVRKTIKVGGKEVEKEVIPHTLVKIETDKMFDNLPARLIADYVKRAKDAFDERKTMKELNSKTPST